MPQSTVINNRQHVGLQKLSALAGVSHSFLGPSKKFKFIQDDTGGESALVCSCHQILEILELPCAVGQLVSETVRAHHKVYHTGSGCLLFLAGAWSRAALDCLHRGIPINHIVSGMFEGLDICMEVCRKSAISIEDFGGWMPSERDAHGFNRQLSSEKKSEVSQESNPVRGMAKVGDKTLKISERRKIKLSRHFCDAKSENITKVPHQPQTPDIAHIARGLSHGYDDTMKIVVEAFQLQSEMNQPNIGSPMFEVSKVLTCVLPALPEECSCVVPGCIVLLSAEQASLAHHLKEQNLKVVFMTGDLSENYRHLGFRKLPGIQSVRDHLSITEDDWVQRVGDLFLTLGVNLILVSGLVCEKVVQRCWRHQILTVEKVKPSVLKALADSTGAVPVSYATQLTEHCVGSGVRLQIWKELRTLDGKSVTAVNISTDSNSRLLTGILTSCLRGKLLTLEEQFWACAYRLHLALKDKALLPGAGQVEILCLHHLRKRVKNNVKNIAQKTKEQAGNHYIGVVLELMADGLIDYISTVMANTGRFSKVEARTLIRQRLGEVEDEEQRGFAAKFSQISLRCDKDEDPVSPAVDVCDILSVKREAWRKAVDVVLLVLQTDAEVITGEGRDSDEAQGNLRL